MHLKSILALTAVVFLIGGAASQAQHHPFSQLFPPDQNLGFDGVNLTGATQLETGSIIANDTNGNLTFRDSTGTETLVWNSNAVRWEVVNSDLDMNNNNIENFFSGACGSGKVVEKINSDGTYSCVDPSEDLSTEGLNETLMAGDIANQSIRMDGNNIEGPGSITNYYQSGVCPTGQVLDGINADGSYDCVDVDDETGVEDLNSTLAAGNEANTSIDMMGNDIDNPGQITSFFSGACGSGKVVEQINSDGSYSCIDPAEDVSTEGLNETLLAGDIANQSIRMDGNDLENPGLVDGLNLDNPGNAIQVSSNQYAIPSGAINDDEVQDNSLTNSSIALNSFTMQSLELTSDLTGTGIVNSAQIASGAVGTSELASDAVTNDSIDNTERVMLNGATMTADADFNGNNLDDVSNIYQDDSNTNFFQNACGSGAVVESIDSNGNLNCVQVDEEATIEPLNDTLAAGNIANQSIRMDGNDIENPGQITSFFSGACGSGKVVEQVNSDGSYSCIDPAEDVSTEGLNETLLAGSIANQTIYMNGNNINDPGQVDGVEIENPGNALEVSSNQYAVSSNSIGNSELANSESFTVNGLTSNADINMNNNAINEVGSGATNITSTGKIEAGADIDAGSNNIDNVNTVNSGGSTLNTGGAIDVGSGEVGATGRMCMGDRCT